MNADMSSQERITVRIPTAAGDEIDAWLYLPDGDGPHPAVVMAHGFAAVKAGGLAGFVLSHSQKKPAPVWPTVSTMSARSKNRFRASQLVSATNRQPWHAAPCNVRSSSAVVGS